MFYVSDTMLFPRSGGCKEIRQTCKEQIFSVICTDGSARSVGGGYLSYSCKACCCISAWKVELWLLLPLVSTPSPKNKRTTQRKKEILFGKQCFCAIRNLWKSPLLITSTWISDSCSVLDSFSNEMKWMLFYNQMILAWSEFMFLSFSFHSFSSSLVKFNLSYKVDITFSFVLISKLKYHLWMPWKYVFISIYSSFKTRWNKIKFKLGYFQG